MWLTLNGQVRRFDGLEAGSTLADLLAELGLQADRVAVEWNGEIAGRGAWGSARLADGDKVEVVHFVGGGCVAVAEDGQLASPELEYT